MHCVSATKSIFGHYHVASFADLEFGRSEIIITHLVNVLFYLWVHI